MTQRKSGKTPRNSLIEFVAYSIHTKDTDNDIVIEGDSIWFTTQKMATLLGTTVQIIEKHLQETIEWSGLSFEENSKTIHRPSREGYSTVEQEKSFYSLNVLFSLCFILDTEHAQSFRKKSLELVAEYTLKGFCVDKERLKNGGVLTRQYFDELNSTIQEIRASERNFYQKITDIYATSIDYDKKSSTTKRFFTHVRDKMYYAIHGQTASEIIMNRADAKKPGMGLHSWKSMPDGKIIADDVVVASNYLTKEECENMNEMIEFFLMHAMRQARRQIPMTMEDWERILNAYLEFSHEEILKDFCRVKREVAHQFALCEFEKYRPIQDRTFESDYDEFLQTLLDYVAET